MLVARPSGKGSSILSIDHYSSWESKYDSLEVTAENVRYLSYFSHQHTNSTCNDFAKCGITGIFSNHELKLRQHMCLEYQ